MATDIPSNKIQIESPFKLKLMKKIIFFSLLFLLSAATFSQQTVTTTSLTKTDYLKKSNHLEKAAEILLVGGVILPLTSLVIVLADAGGLARAAQPLFYTGSLALLASVPCFIIAHHYKKKAMAASAYFKMEHAPQLQQSNLIIKAIPSLTLKISL